MEFDSKKSIRITKFGTYKDLFQTAKKNVCPCRRLRNRQYMDIRTGEVKDYKTSSSTKTNIDSLKKTSKKLERLILGNFTGGDNELSIVLTYASNMTEIKHATKDFKEFIKDWRKVYGKTDYIVVRELQDRLAWHMHVLLKSENMPRWRNEKDRKEFNSYITKKLWIHGHADGERIKSIEGIAKYLSNFTGKKGDKLCEYPAGIPIYSTSRGIVKPISVDYEAPQALQNIKGHDCLNQSEFDITETIDGNEIVLNWVKCARYKK